VGGSAAIYKRKKKKESKKFFFAFITVEKTIKAKSAGVRLIALGFKETVWNASPHQKE